MDKIKVYLLINPKAAVDIRSNIYIKDIGMVYSHNKLIKTKIENLSVYKTKEEEDWIKITSIDIIERLVDRYPNLEIEIIGQNEVLIEIKSREKSNKLFQFAKVVAIFILLFFGAGMTIMNFHTDVNMDETLEIIYYTLTGEKNSNPLILTISYSIGLGLGVIVFFNRILSKSLRRRKEPGPMEIEVFNYDKEMEEYILNDIENSSKEWYVWSIY